MQREVRSANNPRGSTRKLRAASTLIQRAEPAAALHHKPSQSQRTFAAMSQYNAQTRRSSVTCQTSNALALQNG